MVKKLRQLSTSHTPESSLSFSESSTLSRRLDLFNDQRIETIDRILGRQTEIADKLHRWSDWDAHYEQLVDQLRSIETKVTEVDFLNIEEAVAKLQNVNILFSSS